MSERVTPDPIPNSAVKPLSVDDSGNAKVDRRLDLVLSFFILKISLMAVFFLSPPYEGGVPRRRSRGEGVCLSFLSRNLVRDKLWQESTRLPSLCSSISGQGNRPLTLTSTFSKKWSKNFALNKHCGKFRTRHSFLLVRA